MCLYDVCDMSALYSVHSTSVYLYSTKCNAHHNNEGYFDIYYLMSKVKQCKSMPIKKKKRNIMFYALV